jgi:Reverse transcriptase (RNA-dependent DNA polymerase)
MALAIAQPAPGPTFPNGSSLNDPIHADVALNDAWLMVESEDFLNPWLPDVLGFADYRSNRSRLKKAALDAISNPTTFSAATFFAVPKNDSLARPAAVLSITDLLSYAYFAAKAGTGLESVGRIPTVRSGLPIITGSPTGAWRTLHRALFTAAAVRPGWTLRLDIQDFFVNVRLDLLLDRLQSVGLEASMGVALRHGLGLWMSHPPAHGLPQGVSPSRRFASFYLFEIDRALGSSPWPFARFLDDIWVLLERKDQASGAITAVSAACRRLGLSLSDTKMSVTRHPGGPNVKGDMPFPGEGSVTSSELMWLQQSLDRLVDESGPIDRDFAAFALGHLTAVAVAPTRQLLRRAHRLAPLARQFARFVLPWLAHPSVQPYLMEGVSAGNRISTRYLVTWLSAAMLDAGAPIPVEWVQYLRSMVHDESSPGPFRAIAALALLTRGSRADIPSVQRMALTARDGPALRGSVIALATIDDLRSAILERAIRIHPELSITADWLDRAKAWPELLPPLTGWSYA